MGIELTAIKLLNRHLSITTLAFSLNVLSAQCEYYLWTFKQG